MTDYRKNPGRPKLGVCSYARPGSSEQYKAMQRNACLELLRVCSAWHCLELPSIAWNSCVTLLRVA
eukprot:5199482-Pyramimonas_sp.AAC.1